jgi:hypothetical protein
MRVLDIGCGTGAVTSLVAPLLRGRGQVLGVDKLLGGWTPSTTCVIACQRRWPSFRMPGFLVSLKTGLHPHEFMPISCVHASKSSELPITPGLKRGVIVAAT